MKILKFMNSLIILTIIFNINKQILITFGQYVPKPRNAASSEIIGDRLYVLGGMVSTAILNDVIYLDLSKNFTTSSPAWVDYTPIKPLPVYSSYADSCKDKDNKIYLFGGVLIDVNSEKYIMDKQLYVFDGNTWTAPAVVGTYQPAKRRALNVVMDDLGKMYLFCGLGDPILGINDIIFYNDMSIFDSNKLTWTQVTNPPNSITESTSTYLPKNKLILYIGGVVASGGDFGKGINNLTKFKLTNCFLNLAY
jgi:N-acetylneuraminic acid mutarotase